MQSTQKYIYKSAIIEVPVGMLGLKIAVMEKAIDDKMESMAAQGWEFVQITPVVPAAAVHYILIFQKPVLSASDLDR